MKMSPHLNETMRLKNTQNTAQCGKNAQNPQNQGIESLLQKQDKKCKFKERLQCQPVFP